MSLSDIMSAAGLSGYAEVGLVLFLLAFISIAIRTLTRARSAEWERARQLPLLADDIASPSQSDANVGGAP
jgi:hypothetical protein